MSFSSTLFGKTVKEGRGDTSRFGRFVMSDEIGVIWREGRGVGPVRWSGGGRDGRWGAGRPNQMTGRQYTALGSQALGYTTKILTSGLQSNMPKYNSK